MSKDLDRGDHYAETIHLPAVDAGTSAGRLWGGVGGACHRAHRENNCRNNGTFGDDAWWIIILLLCGWGNGGWGFGGGNGGQTTTREEISYGFDMNGLENGVRGIQQGLCDGFYAVNTGMLNGFNGVQSTLCQGFSGVNDAITQSTIADM